MKLKEFKELLNTLSEKELDTDLMYLSDDTSTSGVVKTLEKTKENLYWDGEDDPSRLLTKKEVIEEYDETPAELGFETEIKKGQYYISI